MRKLSYIVSVLTVSLVLFGCKKTLDINKNPNNPADVTIKELLPAAQVSIGQTLGNYFQITGGLWSQYWTQNPNSSQYRSFEQYQPGPASPNTAWRELYAGALEDLDKIIEKADTAENTKNYTAIAKILQGFTYQILTDNFGDIPFSEALKGESKGITSPKYDAQQNVYNGIIQMVKDGRDMISVDAVSPGSDDLIYGGDMFAWGQFANTLLLRMYMRLSEVSPGLAAAGIGELQGDDYGFLTTTAQISYSSNPGNANPLYSEIVNLGFTQNLIASATSTDYLGERDDPRLFVFYTGAAGLEQGYYTIPNPGSYSTPSDAVGGLAISEASALAPVKFISSYESSFLQAEAAARGWLGGDPATLYAEGIQASFAEFGLTSQEDNDYIDTVLLIDLIPYPTGAPLDTQVKYIITEKWVAMNGNQGNEAWAEWRRTGYPELFTVSRTNRTGDQFPVRLPYPETEITQNLNFPGQKLTTDKVWWDTH